ncbi:MAG: CHAT domain-containing protein, partial [Cyanobacteria bacterium J06649_4]
PVLRPELTDAKPLPSLPHAETEAIQIAQLLNTNALVGAAATETAVKQRLEEANLIHLASHGLYQEDGDALQSKIALASNSEEQDGFLTAEEILDYSLQADLVVLSACDTGRGSITGDGVIGLSRSFIAAGTPSVMVSLWQVPDAATSTLMTQFYQNRQTLDKAQSLRQAMLYMIEQDLEPKDWAAFTLIGEAE